MAWGGATDQTGDYEALFRGMPYVYHHEGGASGACRGLSVPGPHSYLQQ